tara:strand:+ start:1099 stop:1404 length:306 start_codon:yes stop_codon:yes gene_type:complete
MWTKSEHQRKLDNNSINPPAALVKGVAGDSRHYWDALGDPPSIHIKKERVSPLIISPISCSIKCFIGNRIEHERQILTKFFDFILMNLPANLDVLHVVRSR